MGRVTTNSLTISAARESSLGVLPGSPVWRQLEPNSISQFGSTISKVARSPITKSRQRRKGIITDLDSSVELEMDLTLSAFRDYMEGFCFAVAIGAPVFTPTAATSGAFTVPAVSAADAGKLIYGATAADAVSLLYARGFDLQANGGLFTLAAAVAASATSITVTGGAVAETPDATDDVELAVAGVRGAAGDLEIDVDGNLISTALDFTTLGLNVGQWVHIGGPDETNRFFDPDNYGFARVAEIAANKLTLERKGTTFVLDDGTDTGSGGTAVRIDLLFGQWVRNVPVGHPDYIEVSTQFELESPNLGTGGADMYEYAMGNYHDSVSINIPLTDKATITYGFIGTDTTDPTLTRATNAANALVPSETAAFGTSSDLARLVVHKVDETGLTTDFKSMTITLSNNVSPEKVLGNLGARYMNAGNFEADIETQVLFTNPDVPAAIKANTTLGLYFALRNEDGGVMCDFPSGTLDGGSREFPENQTVLMSSTFMSFEDPALGYSFSASLFPVLPELD